jgi:hypothetical protein
VSIANALRDSAARFPEDWPPQEPILWEISRAFLGLEEYMGELQQDMPCFLLLVAQALDGGGDTRGRG